MFNPKSILPSLVVILVSALLSACNVMSVVESPDQATVKDGSTLVVVRIKTEDKFIIDKPVQSGCIVHDECNRRVKSHYVVRDGGNTFTNYLFDVRDRLYLMKLAAQDEGTFFMQFSNPSGGKWIQSTRLYFDIPRAGRVYYLGEIRIAARSGQQVVNSMDRDVKEIKQRFPTLQGEVIEPLASYRKGKAQQLESNLLICRGGANVGMSGGTAGVTGYSSECFGIRNP